MFYFYVFNKLKNSIKLQRTKMCVTYFFFFASILLKLVHYYLCFVFVFVLNFKMYLI